MENGTEKKVGSAEWVEQLIHEYWATSPQNTLENGSGERPGMSHWSVM